MAEQAEPGAGVGRAAGAGHTFRAAAMSMFSSVSKGQISKDGWKSCILLRHLDRGRPLTVGCPAPALAHPKHRRLHPLQQQLQAVDGCAAGGWEVVSELP